MNIECPDGEKLYGGGGRVVDGDGYVRLTEMRPLTEYTYAVTAREVPDGYGGAWEVHGYAICGTPQNVQIVEGWNNVGYGTYGQVSLSCPQGTWVTGVGGRVINGGSLQWLRPTSHVSYGAVVVAGVRENTVPLESGFTVVGYAICATKPVGYEIVLTGTQLYTGRTLQISTQCPGAKWLLGAGLTKTDNDGTSRVDAVWPSDRTTVWVTTRQPDASNPIGIAAWAICAD